MLCGVSAGLAIVAGDHLECRRVIPYIPEPTLTLGSYEFQAFTFFAGAAIVVQFQIVMHRAPKLGIDRATASSLLGWAIVLGLVSAHLFDILIYFPERLTGDPLVLLRVWDGLSSMGGMLGELLGVYLVMRHKGLSAADMIRFVDCLIFALPFTLALGRAGCALKHDHPGIYSTHWLAIDFPGGARFDLGLLEMLYLILVCAGFAWLSRQRWPDGFFIGLFFAVYGPVRFLMDTMRVAEVRYLGWTPAQYLSIVAALAGLAILVASLRRGGAHPAES
jgi:phosphatidylglycerol:prolipoprotein diacylglycerol transferase